MCRSAVICVRAGDLDDLVVQPQDQQGRGPLADEQALMLSSRELEGPRADDRGSRGPQEDVGRQFRSLLLDRPRDLAFGMLDTAAVSEILGVPHSDLAGRLAHPIYLRLISSVAGRKTKRTFPRAEHLESCNSRSTIHARPLQRDF